MRETLTALRQALEEEHALYERLAGLAEQQQEALMQRRTDALMEIATDEARLLARAGRLNGDARRALAALGEALGCEAMVPTLGEVMKRLSEEDARPLAEMKERIGATAVRLERTNRINATLLESGLDAVRFTMRLLAETQREPTVCYGGRRAPSRTAALVVDGIG